MERKNILGLVNLTIFFFMVGREINIYSTSQTYITGFFYDPLKEVQSLWKTQLINTLKTVGVVI